MEIVASSHTGRLRRRNEDSVAVDEALGVAVLADGMGGLRDGHVASREAVDAALAHLRGLPAPDRDGFPSRALEEALQAANEQVRERAGGALMGTTLLVASLGAAAGRVAHVGDSRAYRVHRGVLAQLTRDHSLVQDLLDRGVLHPEQARHASNRNVITRAVGLEASVTADCTAFAMAPGDLLLLCSDGLWDMLEDWHIAELLTACGTGRAALEDCADALIDAANAAGGHDNISVALLRL